MIGPAQTCPKYGQHMTKQCHPLFYIYQLMIWSPEWYGGGWRLVGDVLGNISITHPLQCQIMPDNAAVKTQILCITAQHYFIRNTTRGHVTRERCPSFPPVPTRVHQFWHRYCDEYTIFWCCFSFKQRVTKTKWTPRNKTNRKWKCQHSARNFAKQIIGWIKYSSRKNELDISRRISVLHWVSLWHYV